MSVVRENASTDCASVEAFAVVRSPDNLPAGTGRTAHAARLLADSGAVVLVSLVSPFAADRDAARALCDAWEVPFAEAWVATALATCEARDPKGLYARARRGELAGLTGVDAPYEQPIAPELRLDGCRPLPLLVADVLALVQRATARSG